MRKKTVLIQLMLSLTLAGAAIFFTACNTINPNGTAEAPAAPTATPKPVSTAADFINSNPNPTGITVTLWTVEQFSPQISLVNQTLTAFSAAYPADGISTFVKKESGQASATSYLLSAKNVAPDILPDVVIVRDDQLPQIWRAGLAQPLDAVIDRTIVQDLLPAARTLGTIDGQLAAIPLQLNTEHLVVNTTFITPTPLAWNDVLSANVRYNFAGGNASGGIGDATLAQYVAAGGTFSDETGAPAISEDALRAVLEYYAALRENDLITSAMFDSADSSTFWTAYKKGELPLTHIDAHTFLADRHQLQTSLPAAIPTQSGTPTAVVHGWVIVLLTNDPFRQQSAINLIETFLTPEATAAWASYAQSVPPRRAAFSLIAGNDSYWQFLDDYLSTAIATPTFAEYPQMSRAIQQAVKTVVAGTATIDEALQTVKNDLGQ